MTAAVAMAETRHRCPMCGGRCIVLVRTEIPPALGALLCGICEGDGYVSADTAAKFQQGTVTIPEDKP